MDREQIKLSIESRNSWLRFIVALMASTSFFFIVGYIILSGKYADELGWAAWTAFTNVTLFIILQWLFKRKEEKDKFEEK